MVYAYNGMLALKRKEICHMLQYRRQEDIMLT